MAVAVKPDNKAVVEFLVQWSKTGPWLLTAIQVGGKAISTKSFTAKTKKALQTWLTEFNGKRNIYFHVNPTMKEMKKKAMEKDVKAVTWFHVDIDPRAENLKTKKEKLAFLKKEQKRALGLLTDKLPKSIPEPTVIVFSGGGYQGFWKLKKPISIKGDLKKVEDAKLYNLRLEQIFEGDHCHLRYILKLTPHDFAASVWDCPSRLRVTTNRWAFVRRNLMLTVLGMPRVPYL